jgi:D-alanyl-D-alanine carboxypeptidase (penicillin-binding protein 5/6)
VTALAGWWAPAFAGQPPSPSTTAPAGPPPAKAELLADLDTGRVLFAQNEHALLPPASLTKILTALVAADWIVPGTEIPVSDRAANVSPDKLGMKTGQQWPYDITMHALLISSSNDAAYALAEKVAGSVEAFSSTMQQAASEMGMTDPPVLRDPAGLDGSEGVGGGNVMSAWDIAVASRDLMANPYLSGIVGTKTFRFTGPDGIVYQLASHNLAFLNTYPGAVGIKTGYTDPAGVCLSAVAVRGDRHMLAVVMNGVSPDRTAEMLLDQGFGTPVESEPATDPTLPPVVEPEPAAASPQAGDPPAPETRISGSSTDAAVQARSSGVPIVPTVEAAAGVITLFAVAAALLARGRRRVAAGSHFSRR